MNQPFKPPPPNRGLVAIDGALALITILLITQMWLLTAALETYLAGHRDTALPSAIVSGLLFLISLGLHLFVNRIDAMVRRPRS